MSTFEGLVEESTGDCIQAAVGILDQGIGLLEGISDEVYCRKLAVASDASIGGHYRHCLDHFDCLLEGIQSGTLDYDKRRREGRVETVRAAALKMTEDIRESLLRIHSSALQRSIAVSCKVHYAVDRSQQVGSTVVRELMYAVAHAVHHFALIAVMAKVMDFQLPREFGVAPSTLQHRSQMAASAGVMA
ncbi:MAG: hypothetical protein M2R45_03501 [Verrucomicrobia subdivision 3 bacterium]|nr:hypothetical protein [Limisphaerales bacterium]MCS1415897.1 hypothetical protein [Limisphaerales bacterium]